MFAATIFITSPSAHNRQQAGFRYQRPGSSCQSIAREVIASSACVMIVTAHSAYDRAKITGFAKCVVDTRHVVV